MWVLAVACHKLSRFLFCLIKTLIVSVKMILKNLDFLNHTSGQFCSCFMWWLSKMELPFRGFLYFWVCLSYQDTASTYLSRLQIFGDACAVVTWNKLCNETIWKISDRKEVSLMVMKARVDIVSFSI